MVNRGVSYNFTPNIHPTMPTPLTITLIQSQLHWEDKEANLKMFEEKIKSVRGTTEMVVLPEMFSTGFSMKPEQLAEKMDGATVQWMERVARENRLVVTGSLMVEEEQHYYNRLIWMLPVGQYGYYDKRHLFAYAGEDQHYTRGKKRLVTSVKKWRVHFQICYDLRFPVWSSQQSLLSPLERKRRVSNFDALSIPSEPEYDVLVYVANWPERRSLAWKTLLQARAIENQCYVIGVNRTGSDGDGVYYSGDSMVIDPLGEIMYHKAHKDDVFTLTLQKDELLEIRNKFPFWRDTDHFMIFTNEEEAVDKKDGESFL